MFHVSNSMNVLVTSGLFKLLGQKLINVTQRFMLSNLLLIIVIFRYTHSLNIDMSLINRSAIKNISCIMSDFCHMYMR